MHITHTRHLLPFAGMPAKAILIRPANLEQSVRMRKSRLRKEAITHG